MDKKPREAVFVGAGIMSATLSILLKNIDPNLKITVYEKLDLIGSESSDAFNNAGTGHSAFCELNYTPEDKDGNVSIDKAESICKQFELSKQFWSYLIENKYIQNPKDFIRNTPHMSFVWGEKDVNFLEKRYEAMRKSPFFKQMKFSTNPETINEWAPLIVNGRNPSDKIAATRMNIGTDVNFGALTRLLFDGLVSKGEITLKTKHEVKDLTKKGEQWEVKVKDLNSGNTSISNADFVFIGAGGGAILLLQKTGIPESKIFGGFPVGGEWLICNNEEVIKQHHAKVYGKAQIGAPPMSVPHLDTRVIDGKLSLLFGPFAVFNTRFLKSGSKCDLLKSVNFGNVGFMVSAGLANIPLTKYLIEQVMLSKEKKIESLREYFPEAKSEDWFEKVAGQRVQVIQKSNEGKGELKFGTEIVASQDGSISALLGASPGASTSVFAMLNILQKCFPELMKGEWNEKIKEMIPSYDTNFATEEELDASRKRTHEILELVNE